MEEQNKKKKKEKSKREKWPFLAQQRAVRSVREEKRERNGKKKYFFHFSLRSTEIEPSVFVGARRKVDPRIASYA